MTRTRSAKTFQQKFSLAGECLLVSSAIINTHYWELRRRKFCREIREYILQSLPFSVTISSWTFPQAPHTVIWGWSSGLSVKTLPVVQRYFRLAVLHQVTAKSVQTIYLSHGPVPGWSGIYLTLQCRSQQLQRTCTYVWAKALGRSDHEWAPGVQGGFEFALI